MRNLFFQPKVLLPVALLLLALAAVGCSESSKSSGVIPWSDDGTAPNNPSWKIDVPFVVAKAGQNFYTVTLDWNPVTTNKFDEPKKNIVGYYVFRRREGAAEKKVATTTDDHYIDKDVELVEGERYIYTIVAFDNLLRQSAPSAPQLVRLEPTVGKVPMSPSNLFFSPGSQSTLSWGKGDIIISWDPPTKNMNGSLLDDLMEFEIARHEGNLAQYTTIAKVPAGKNLFIDSNLNLGTYYYRVRAVNKDYTASQWIDGSLTLTGRTDDIAPGMITNLTASGDAKVVLTWRLPLTDVNFYSLDIYGVKVYRKKLDSADPYVLVKVLPPNTTWTDLTVDIDSYYQYSVTAFDLSGNESAKSRPATNRVGVTFPDTPGGFAATLFVGRVVLSWAAVPGAYSYVVYRSEHRDGIYVRLGETTGNIYTDSVNSTKNYYYKVAAKDGNGREGSPTHHVLALAELTVRRFEAEGHINMIGRGFNAINAPFDIEVDVLSYPYEQNAFLLFSPISPSAGERVDGNPLPNLDSDAVGTGTGDGDWFEFSEWFPNPVGGLFSGTSYQAELWSMRTGDSGIYQVWINGVQAIGAWDNYSTRLDLQPTRVSFTVSSIIASGQQVPFRFVCMAKNPDSIDYKLYLDKIVIR